MDAASELFDQIVNPKLPVRRLYLTAAHVTEDSPIVRKEKFEQMDLFTDYVKLEQERKREAEEREKEKRWQKAMLDIKKKYGKNAILRGMNFEEGATARERNDQIGGHKA